MKRCITGVLLLLTVLLSVTAQEREYVIVVHGGAGAMRGLENRPDLQAHYYAALDSALHIGDSILAAGGEGPLAVRAVIRYFESNPLFNAGIGATVSATGCFELDAALMEGKDLSAGSVTGVQHVKHPIDAAYQVKEHSVHVMLSGSGADEFAREQGLEMVEDNLYFATPRTMQWVEKFKQESKKNGTVGCVVLDRQGNLTAGTSTGGMLQKKWGRIGDSPVIGAGTYADNRSCAVSCTGHGEYFIRHAVAFDVCARHRYLQESVQQAADAVIHGELSREEGNGGLIAVDKDGQIGISFNSEGMFHGYLYKEKGQSQPVQKMGIFPEKKQE